MTIAPLVLKGRVMWVVPGNGTQLKRRAFIDLPEIKEMLCNVPGDHWRQGESVTITLAPDNPEYGSEVLKDIQATAEEI